MTATFPEVAPLTLPDTDLRIGGRTVAPASGETIDALNPATEETITRLAAGGAEDVDRAVAADRKSVV